MSITNVSAVASPVLLHIALINPSTAVVFWPTSAVNFGLQSSTNLVSGTWSNITSGVATVSTNYTFTNPVTLKSAFFRLQGP